MTNEQKKMKRYMTAIERRLDLPREIRSRVMTDLQSSVTARREAGQTDEQIFAEMGRPEAVAAELNEQMKEYAYIKSKWRWAALLGAVLAGGVLSLKGVMGLLAWLLNASVNDSAGVGIIGGADGPTTVFVTTAPGGFNWTLGAMGRAMCRRGGWKRGHCRQNNGE